MLEKIGVVVCSLIIFTFLQAEFSVAGQKEVAEVFETAAMADSPKDIFNAVNIALVPGTDIKVYLGRLLECKSNEDIKRLQKINDPMINNKEYRNSHFELLKFLNDENLLDREMIDLAKAKIVENISSTSPIDKFMIYSIPEAQEFYKAKYNDRYVMNSSDSWVKSVAAVEIIKGKIDKSFRIGQKLNKPELIHFGKELACLIDTAEYCRSSAMKADGLIDKIETIKSERAREEEAAKESIAQKEAKRKQLERQTEHKLAMMEEAKKQKEAAEQQKAKELKYKQLEEERLAFCKSQEKGEVLPLDKNSILLIATTMADNTSTEYLHKKIVFQQLISRHDVDPLIWTKAAEKAMEDNGFSRAASLREYAENIVNPFDNPFIFNILFFFEPTSEKLSELEKKAVYCPEEIKYLKQINEKYDKWLNP